MIISYVKWTQKFKMRSNGVSVSKVEIVNGCNGAHEQGLRILIVGAGIGGLTAAIALRKQGHRVLVMPGPKCETSSLLILHFSCSNNHDSPASWEQPFISLPMLMVF